MADDKLFVSFLTRQCLRQLEDDGFELTKIKTFYCAVRKFYKACFHYAVKNLPLDDVVLRHSRFANFASRKDVSIEDVEYFIDRYSTILKFGAPEFDSLHDEFISYQLLSDDDIPPQVIKEAKVTSKLKDDKEEKHLRMDVTKVSLPLSSCQTSTDIASEYC